MDTNDLYDWLQKERSSAILIQVPEQAYTQLVALFKNMAEGAKKNMGDCFAQIYALREQKITRTAIAKANGFQVIAVNAIPEEMKLYEDLIAVLTDARKCIFPFLRLPHTHDGKPEFEDEPEKVGGG